MPIKHVVVNGLLKTIQVDDAGNQISNLPSTPASTLADPDKALTFSTNFTDANNAAQAAGTQLAPSTIQALETVQSQEYLNKFGNPQVANTAIYDLTNQIFTKIQAPIGLLNKLLVLQSYNINIKIDDSGSMNDQRWWQAKNRLLEMMDVLQVVPTGPVTLSFLNRRDRISIIRYGKTPAQFYQEVANWINQEFQKSPSGGTPMYRNVDNMFTETRGQTTAHFILTDGVPTGYGNYEEAIEREIADVKNRILYRENPLAHPIQLMCCSPNPDDTEWMHEVETIACMPGTAPAYVAALQNFDAERLEVLNDQGAWLPYTRSVWLICSLVAALNPNDLDALDQHAPLSKPILDSFLGRLSTMSEYEGYFLQHPNATWLFKEDFELFVKTEITNQIPAVAYFESVLGQKLSYAINCGNDNSEFSDIASTEQMLLNHFNRQRPLAIFQQRQIFWGHYSQMDKQQLQSLRYQKVVSQHLWADYIALSNMGNIWQAYVQDCHSMISEVVQRLAQVQQQQQQMAADQQPVAEGQEPPPPPYSADAISLSAPQYDTYNPPQYYAGRIQPVEAVYNQSSSSQVMWRPAAQQQYSSSQQNQASGGYDQQYNQQYRQSCCTLS